MKYIFKRLLMVAALCVAFPMVSWGLGTPAGFTVNLSSAQGAPTTNPLQQQMTGGSANMAITNPLTGAIHQETMPLNLLWEFNYANNHMEIVGLADTRTAASTCTIDRTVTVNDSRTGLAISGAAVTIGNSTLNTNAQGSAAFTAISMSTLAGSSVNVQVTAPNYSPGNTQVVAACGTSGTTNITLLSNVIAASGNVTAVLTWGLNPRDLDSHLTGPKTTGPTPRFHVYFGASNRAGAGAAMTASNATIPAFLDRDDTTSYGPETTTILSPVAGAFVDGVYRFSVHHWSGTGTLETSGAVVKIYQGATLLGTYTPPANQTVGTRYWSVCEINVVNGAVNVTGVGTYGGAFAASVAGAASGAIPVVTPLGDTVYTEDPAIFSNMPAK